MMFILYYRLYITYTLTVFLFDLDQSNVCRDIQKIESLIRKCLPIPQKLYRITKKRLQTPEEVEKYFPGFIAITDCTEQQIPRPIDKRRRQVYYSGKKKRHTVKNQLVVNNQGYIIYKLSHKKGRRYDYNIYKTNHHVIPKDVVNMYVLGYLGIEKDFTEQMSALSYRKKKNQVITRRKRLQ